MMQETATIKQQSDSSSSALSSHVRHNDSARTGEEEEAEEEEQVPVGSPTPSKNMADNSDFAHAATATSKVLTSERTRGGHVQLSNIRGSPLTSSLGRGGGGAKADRATPSNEEDHPFSPFANSFDSLSEAGHYSFSMDHPLSPTTGLGGSATTGGGRRIDTIALPELKHDADSYSLGDISPIKLVYNNGGSHNDAVQRRLEEGFMNIECQNNNNSNNGMGDPSALWKTNGGGLIVSENGVSGGGGGGVHISNPFFVMRSARKAFEGCKYLLPCLRGEDVCPVNVSTNGHIHHYRGQQQEVGDTPLVDVKIATRRVETAICAFGGSLTRKKNDARSIFRLRASEKQYYDSCLPNRYYLSGSFISWEVEENPPISIDADKKKRGIVMGTGKGGDERSSNEHHRRGDSATGSGLGTTNQSNDEARKMKYRCKLCGQLKQNHDCPYRQSLHRSIGVMVYPAVNSFTAAEPGAVAPPLTKMNNFVSYDSKSEPTYTSAGALSTKHPSPSQLHVPTVTPASLTGGAAGCFYSPQSSLSNHSDEVSDENGGHHQSNKRQKRSDVPFQRAVFVASVTLRPEHYRAVNPTNKGGGGTGGGGGGGDNNNKALSSFYSTAYQYPVIPLTFAERKRLSDTLFHLSKEIPSMTADTASLLRDARKNNEWDLAVSELLTQAVVGLYCGEGDACLEGLSQYLLTLGIAC